MIKADLFWAKVDQDGPVHPTLGTACWQWVAARTKRQGYGLFTVDGRSTPAHRVAYQLLVGPIRQGLQLDHLCRNRSCVNPAHLEPVTVRENLLRGKTLAAQNTAKTHCPKGHEYTPENTWMHPRYGAGGGPGRECKECRRVYHLAWRHRKA